MESLLNEYQSFASAYIEDIIVHSEDVEGHEKHLQRIQGILDKDKL